MSTETTPLHITREGPRSFIGRNARGAEVRIGGSDADGVFSPGELLHLALAACGMLSSDHILASRLGADFEATTDITATKPEGEDRYDSITAVIRADLSALDPERIASLSERTHRAIDRQCTVGHTLEHGAAYTVDVVDDQTGPVSGPRTGTI